jgi:hypothetical protein
MKMSLTTLIVKLLEQIGSSRTHLLAQETPTGEPQNASSIKVTPARRPIWPTCCG